jgi:D-methionine transport system ATP-binding protein
MNPTTNRDARTDAELPAVAPSGIAVAAAVHTAAHAAAHAAAPAVDAPLLHLEAVSRVFGTVVALDRVQFSVRRGEIFGIIGRSGAGKSTLIRTINGLERIDAGRITVDGQDLSRLDDRGLNALRRKIGMIFQHFNLLSSKTVFDNVALPLKLAGRDAADRAAAVWRMLDLVGLRDKAHVYPAQLSGGQQQRVGIARALVAGPGLLLSDEATSALDPETTLSILRLLKQVNRALGVTIVLITHEMSVIREICDQVAILDHGRLIEQGPVAQVFAAPRAELTRRLLRTVRPPLPDALQALLHDAPIDGGRTLLRVASSAADRYGPILAALARDPRWQTEIVHAELDQIQSQAVGTVTFSLRYRGEEAMRALRAALQEHWGDVEELGYVAG